MVGEQPGLWPSFRFRQASSSALMCRLDELGHATTYLLEPVLCCKMGSSLFLGMRKSDRDVSKEAQKRSGCGSFCSLAAWPLSRAINSHPQNKKSKCLPKQKALSMLFRLCPEAWWDQPSSHPLVRAFPSLVLCLCSLPLFELEF